MKGYCLVSGLGANMQSLVVQVLAMRQLGRLNPVHLRAVGYGLRQTEWCPRTIHTRQLWGCCAVPTLRYKDAIRSCSVQQLRFKSNKKKNASKKMQEEEEEEDEEEEEEEEERTVDSDFEDEDANVPPDYKDLEKHVASFRYDMILKAGLDIARSKIDDAFYSGDLRLNGYKLIKKSKTVKVGDTLDLVLTTDSDSDTVTVMRAVLTKVLGESRTEKYKVSLRRWKSLELPKEEALKT